MKSSVLSHVSELVSQGEIIKSIDTLKSQIQNFGQKYSLFSNLGALYLQQGQIEYAIQQLNKAISLDPFSYIAYYNRFLCFYTNGHLIYAWSDLKKSLSCLYMQKGYKEQNLKYLNKSIVYCQRNAKAYLYRAKLNEGKNIKLIENDYQAAILYYPNLIQIYQQRALFYRKLKKMRQFEQNLQIYNSLKRLRKSHINQLIDNDNLNESQNLSYKQRIQQGIIQLLQLLHKNQYKHASFNKNNINNLKINNKQYNKQLQIAKLPLDSLHSKIEIENEKEDDNLLSSQRDDNQPQSTQTLQIKRQLVNFRKPSDQIYDKKFRQIFQDQNSGQLNRQIDNIERQIMAYGGRLSLGQQNNQQLDISDPSNFLTKQIQKTIQQIQIFCQKEMLSDVKSVKSLRSNGSSKINNNKEITNQQFKQYSKVNIQIIELNDLQDCQHKQQAHIEIFYNHTLYETSIQRYQWNENLVIPIKGDSTEMEIKAISKGGVFKNSSTIGEGTINLLDNRQTKCLLGNKQRKTAILFFKIQLT